MKRPSLEQIVEELKEREPVSPGRDEEGGDDSFDSGQTKTRGRPALLLVWSRVIHVKPGTNAAPVSISFAWT